MKLPGRTLFLLGVIAAVLWVGYLARAVVTPLIAALLLAYVLDPVVRRLERFGIGRNAASAFVVAVAFVATVVGAGVAAGRLVGEATVFYRDVVGEPARASVSRDAALVELEGEVGESFAAADVRSADWSDRTWWYLDDDHDGKFRPGYAREGLDRVRRALDEHPATKRFAESLAHTDDLGPLVARSASEWFSGVVDTGREAIRSALGILTLAVLFPIYLYYSLSKLAWVYDVGVRHLPAEHREQVVGILAKIHATLSAFFRGRLILLLVRYVVLLALFYGFGVPFAGVCAAFGAVASLVPVFGPVAGGAIPLLLLLAEGATDTELLALALALVVLEVADQYVLTPAIVGKRVGMHPLTILVATFVAGDLLGLFGMLVAIPLTAIVKILAQEFVLPEVRRRAGIDEPPAEPTK